MIKLTPSVFASDTTTVYNVHATSTAQSVLARESSMDLKTVQSVVTKPTPVVDRCASVILHLHGVSVWN